MKTDKQIYLLLAAHPDVFRLLTEPGSKVLLDVFLSWLMGCEFQDAFRRRVKVLLDVFLSWLMERHKDRNFEEIMRMLQVLTPLEETRAYQQLVGIGKQKEARAILRKQLARRFGMLPPWAVGAAGGGGDRAVGGVGRGDFRCGEPRGVAGPGMMPRGSPRP